MYVMSYANSPLLFGGSKGTLGHRMCSRRSPLDSGSTPMTTLPSAFRLLLGRPTSDATAREEHIGLRPIVPAPAARSAAKRTMDVVGALGGLILLSPVLVIVALLIKVDS